MVGHYMYLKEGGTAWGCVLFNYIAKIGGFILKTSWSIGVTTKWHSNCQFWGEDSLFSMKLIIEIRY